MKKHSLILFALFAIGHVTAQDVADRIVEYAISKEGKKIDRGECWDLVAKALEKSGADWNPPEGFGEKFDHKKQRIQPGDIVEFKNVRMTISDRSKIVMPQHYGIVVESHSEERFTMAHQNYNNIRKVALTELDLSSVDKGKIQFFRPH